MKNQCGNCYSWRFEQMDDANERYGRCAKAYEGADEAYPMSNMLLKIEGPEEHKNKVYAKLLTHEGFSCKEWN